MRFEKEQEFVMKPGRNDEREEFKPSESRFN